MQKDARDRQNLLRILLADHEFVEVFHELYDEQLAASPSPNTRRGTPVSELPGPPSGQGGRLVPLVGHSHMTGPGSGYDVPGGETNEHVELIGLQIS